MNRVTNETDQSPLNRRFGGSATQDLPVDRAELRAEVQLKYAAVALAPDDDYHFHTGRAAAERCRYDVAALDALPALAIESFAGVANPFELRSLEPGERVVDLGAGAGFDSFLAGLAVGPEGQVIGVDMTPEMLAKARSTAVSSAPTTSSSVPAISKICPSKTAGLTSSSPTVWSISAPTRRLPSARHGVYCVRVESSSFADFANGKEVPEGARREIDLWTG